MKRRSQFVTLKNCTYQVNRAKLFHKNGEHNKAIEIYSTILQDLNPTEEQSYDILCNRSTAFFEVGQFQESLSDANTAIKVSPHKIKAYYRAATALIHLKSLKEAFTCLLEALQLQPEHPQLRALLDKLAKQMNQQFLLARSEEAYTNAQEWNTQQQQELIIQLEAEKQTDIDVEVEEVSGEGRKRSSQINVQQVLFEDWQILGVSKGGKSKDQIRKAFLQKSLILHPDKGGSEIEFQRLLESYHRLLSTFSTL
eukprot:TRINITY_DN4788_c0_g1_i2.p1 TRINITY_DN4788_c0_g1~~TRINITY_DN4788_c0_g1_i2.p1  ORF type:complete len:254 (+),score=16.67 TRINITY_DN4788_c0_g1_i2:110-871(+)